MYKLLYTLLFLLVVPAKMSAQFDTYNQMDTDGNVTTRRTKENTDSLGTDKEVPKGIKVWTVDEKFGDRHKAEPDTLSHMFMNTIFTTGLKGEYNTTGNLGAPRINRIFIDRMPTEQFLFTQPYDFFVKPVSTFHFLNTLSPITNISYNTAGNRTNGEDHLNAKFGVNAGKRLGVGFIFDYIYGRGYYQNQSTSHFNYTMFGSYLGDHYQAHLLLSTNHQKVTENGGITNDNYISHPESFDDNFAANEIPTVLENNWNRNDNQHVFLTQRYNVGFSRKVKMTEEEIKARKFAMDSKRDKQLKAAKLNGKSTVNNDDNDEASYAGRPDDAVIAGNEPDEQKSAEKPGRVTVGDKATADSLLAIQDKAK